MKDYLKRSLQRRIFGPWAQNLAHPTTKILGDKVTVMMPILGASSNATR